MKMTNIFKTILITFFLSFIVFIPSKVNAQITGEPGYLGNSSTTGIYHCADDIEGSWSLLDENCRTGYMPDISVCYDACLVVIRDINGNDSIGDAEITACRGGNIGSVTVGCVVDPDYVPPTPPDTGGDNEGGALEGTGGGGGTVTKDDFDALNPLKQAARTSGTGDVSLTLTTPGAIISRILEFAFPLAGFILFIMLFWGGFEILYGSSTSKSMENGKNRITSAIIGFFLLFSSFWIIQILQEILGIESFLS